jgi:hypothetical protein
MFNIAKMKPAPETGRGLFESDGSPGSRLRILPAHQRLGVANELPSEPSIAGMRERAGGVAQVHVRRRPGQRRSAVRIGPGGIGFAPEMMA